MGDKLAVPRVQSGNRFIDELFARLRELATLLALSPLFGGRLIDAEPGQPAGSGLAFTAGQSRIIAHKLGRKARCFVELYPVDVVSAARVNLRPVAFPTNVTSETHVSVSAQNAGSCFLVVL